MPRIRWLIALIACLVLTHLVIAGEPLVPLTAAHGTVEKAGKDSVKIRPRGADGKFEKSVVLKITGTSRLSILDSQVRGGKVVLVQRDAHTKELQPHQPITVIYSTEPSGSVLLFAVVQPERGK